MGVWKLRRVPPAIALAIGAILIASTSAFAAPVAISGPSPYSACTAGAESGTLFPNAEVEPQVSVAGSFAVAAWQQDRWSDGGSHGIAGAASTDGGATWTRAPLPFSVCAQPYFGAVAPYERASDPWVSIGPDGTVYANALVFNDGNLDNGVYAATSHDGLHWNNLRAVVEYVGNGGKFSTDKNAITADPIHAGVAYSVWDTLISPDHNPDNFPHAAAYTGEAYFSKTTDGGRSWSTPKVIFSNANRTQTIGNVIVVDSQTGALYDFASWIVKPNSSSNTQYFAAFVKSTDGGTTWSAPKAIARMFAMGVGDPNTGAPLRTEDGIPSAAIDPATGQLYVAWQESSTFKRGNNKFRSDDTITLATSTDGGASWTLKSPVNTFTGLPAFIPTVQVGTGGRVAISYYDVRNLAADNKSTLPADLWITYSNDHGATFGGERHVAGPFNYLAAAFALGFFLGDYQALGAESGGFLPVFGMTNCNDASCANNTNRQDIYAAPGF